MSSSSLAATRRRLLAFGVGGTALLAGGCALSSLLRGAGDDDDDGPPSAALTPRERAVVFAIVEALFPARAPYPAGVDVGVVERIDEELFSQPDATREDLKAAINLIDVSAPLVGAWGRMSTLPVDERARALQALMQRGPAVVVYATTALKQLASVAYFAEPRVWGAIGYDGPWIPQASPPPSRARYLAEIGRVRAARRPPRRA